METKIRLDNEQLDNQHDPPLQTHRTIPASISTDNFTIVSDIKPPPNITSVLSLDLNTSEGSAGELAIDYFQMIQNNNQVKDKYKARIDKGEKWQMNLKGALKGSTVKTGALYRCGIVVLRNDIWEHRK